MSRLPRNSGWSRRRLLRAAGAGVVASVVGCGTEPDAPLEGIPAGPHRLTLRFAPSPPRPAVATRLGFDLTHTASGAPVQDLQIVHERALHTFIVARDFSSFAHLHHEDFAPLDTPTGGATFEFPYTFPAAGDYFIVCEFTHRDRTWTKRFDFRVGHRTDRPVPQIDLTRTRTVGAYTATLHTSPARPVAGHEAELVLHVAREGVPVTNLELLLGAEVHVAVWRRDGAHFGHTHSYTPAMAKMMREMAGHAGHSAAMMLKLMSQPAELVYTGPRIPIRFTFPEPGIYQLFVQCAPGGRNVVFPFTLDIPAPRADLPTVIDSIVPDA
ncbi:MAG: hypothetical protein AB7V59_14660 [Gammaproteobacteria bacterium]